MLAEDTPILHSKRPGDPPWEEFNPLVIKDHTANIQLPEGTRTPFQISSLFFSPDLLNMMVAANQ